MCKRAGQAMDTALHKFYRPPERLEQSLAKRQGPGFNRKYERVRRRGQGARGRE